MPHCGVDAAGLLEGLDADQREAVLTDAAPLVSWPRPGSGKTRVLTHRIARRVLDGSADARHVLALTFTRRAAGELQRRLGRLGLRDRPTAGTFHGVAWSCSRSAGPTSGRARPELLVDRTRLLEPSSRPARRRGRRRIGAPRTSASRARLGQRPPGAARALRRARPGADGRPPAAAARGDRRAVRGLRRARSASRRVLDFDDLLELCAARAATTTRPSPTSSAGASATSSSTSSRTSTRCSSACSRPGGADGPTSAWSATRTRRSTGGTAPTRRCCRGSRALVGGVTVVRLDRSYRSTPQVLRRHGRAGIAAATARPAAAVRPDGPRAPGARLRRRARRGRRHRRAAGRAPAGPAVVVVRGAGPHPRPGRPASSAPCATPGSRHGCGTTDRCSTARRAGGAAPSDASAEPLGDVVEELEHRLAIGAAEAGRRSRARRAAPAVLARPRAARAPAPAATRRDLPGVAGRRGADDADRRRRRRRAHLPRRQGPRVAPGGGGRRRGRARPPRLGHRRRGPGRGGPARSTSPSPAPSTSCTARGPGRGAATPVASASPRPCSRWSASAATPTAGRRRRRGTASRPAGRRPGPGADGAAPVAGAARPWRPTSPSTLCAPTTELAALATVRPTTARRAGRRPRAAGRPATGPPAAPAAGRSAGG